MTDGDRNGGVSAEDPAADWLRRLMAEFAPSGTRSPPGPRRFAYPDHPELDCLRAVLPRPWLGWAASRAVAVGTGADRALMAAGLIDEDTYLAALAADLGVDRMRLDRMSRAACVLPDDRLSAAAAAGLLPVRHGGRLVWVIAPRETAARRLVYLLARYPHLAPRIGLVTAAELERFVVRHGVRALGRLAADQLRLTTPDLSAAPRRPRRPRQTRRRSRWPAAMTMVAATFLVDPVAAGIVLDLALAAVFLAWAVLRLHGAAIGDRSPPAARVPDARLPAYSIIVALYDEPTAVAGLAAALMRIDYPIEKLDITFVLEPDDRTTREAVSRLRLGPPFTVVLAPATGPRTKPKALNAGLALARGSLVAVFDAEDRPEPDQLRAAAAAFVAGDARLACVQARLTIDNTSDSWLTRLFTAEYAALFDVFLPGLAARHLPLPLGGSSNHFPTAVLRAVGGWDPYNVTEDADLGMRLARQGFRTAMIGSTTYEEAPARLAPWLRQRTRWFKGWMQTWLVHMRAPRRLARELGPAGFAVFQLVVGGTVLSALVHPLFVATVLARLPFADVGPSPAGIGAAASAALYGGVLAAGYGTSALLGLVGLARRGLVGTAWVLLLVPVHWALLSIAAWRAAWQLARDPYRWEKTPHGLARSSRRRARPPDRPG